jgi:8-oxo-dGTP pyrophosphatase MutT (NUDIX family)
MSTVLLQVGVKAALKNADGKILLLQRSKEKYGETKGTWDIVGGRIDAGARLIENLRREVREETGLELASEPHLIAAQDILSPERHVVRLTYTAYAEGEPVLDTSENITYRWVTLDELKTQEDLDLYVQELIKSGRLTSGSWD